MGFDTSRPVYHGTNADFPAFSDEFIGSRTDAGQMGRGHYFGTDPRVVNGSDAVGIPAYLKTEKPLRVEQPDFRTDKRFLVREALGLPRDATPAEVAAAAKAQGYDSVELDMSPTGYKASEIAVFDPANIRSVHAKFDPAQAGSADLLASRGVGYNPKPLPQRPFHDDYPAGARGDGTGRLATSIEGVELNAPFVAGRRSVGGVDEGLDPAAIAGAAREAGADVGAGPAGIPRGAAGSYQVEPNADLSGLQHTIRYSPSLKEPQAQRVVAHEFGHMIDKLASRIDQKGLTKELEQVYSDLATGMQGRTRQKTGPIHLGYRPEEAPRELMAEALRAYMTDPNYLKSAAPKTAKAIREAVNTNPRIAPVIQFNAMAPVGGISMGTPPRMSYDEYEAMLAAGQT
jgi:hypothetical protein